MAKSDWEKMTDDEPTVRKEAKHWGAMLGQAIAHCRKPRRSAEAGLEASPGSLTNGNEVTYQSGGSP